MPSPQPKQKPKGAPTTKVQPRKRPRQGRSKVTVDAMVMAAARVLTERGVAGLTTNHIARAAGVSVGSLYQYFPNKDSVLAALTERYITRDFEVFKVFVQEMKDTPLDIAVPLLVRGMYEVYQEHGEVRRILFDEMSRLGKSQLLNRTLRAYVAEVRRFLQDHGATVPSVELAAFLLLYGIEGVMRATVLDAEAEVEPDELTAEMTRMVLAYLGA